MSSTLDGTDVKPLAPDSPFVLGGQRCGSVSDFWRWHASDLLSNTLRGILAEYIVARATQSPKTVRQEWGAYDIETREGYKVEVKSSAYLQSWPQDCLSKIQFDVSGAFEWDAKTNQYDSRRIRPSDIYVFAILDHKDKGTVNPLNLDQWIFYVSPTSTLDEELKEQKVAGISTIQELTKKRAVRFNELAAEVRRCGSLQSHNTALQPTPLTRRG